MGSYTPSSLTEPIPYIALGAKLHEPCGFETGMKRPVGIAVWEGAWRVRRAAKGLIRSRSGILRSHERLWIVECIRKN